MNALRHLPVLSPVFEAPTPTYSGIDLALLRALASVPTLAMLLI